MANALAIGGREVGDGCPVYIVAEIGINHNGSLELAKKLIDAAVVAGCDAVKFQKRTPELCVPEDLKNVLRETPWGLMTYLEYRHRVEFGKEEYGQIERYCASRGIQWFTSCWDEPSVEFMEQFDPVAYKIASASVTDDSLLRLVGSTERPIVISTGMSTIDEIRHGISLLDRGRLLIAHATSTYPCKPPELNLRMITTLRELFGLPTGYSGHEVGLGTTCAAVVLGACYVERHITLDRSIWGTDQAASVEPMGFMRLVRDIRTVEVALGDGVKHVYESEYPVLRRLRRHWA